MTKQEIEEMIKKYEKANFFVEMKDHMTNDDYMFVRKNNLEIEKLREELKKIDAK